MPHVVFFVFLFGLVVLITSAIGSGRGQNTPFVEHFRTTCATVGGQFEMLNWSVTPSHNVRCEVESLVFSAQDYIYLPPGRQSEVVIFVYQFNRFPTQFVQECTARAGTILATTTGTYCQAVDEVTKKLPYVRK